MTSRRARGLPGLDPLLPLADRLAVQHGRIRSVAPGVERLAFVIHHPRNGLLSTYLSHSSTGAGQRFEEHPLVGIPSLSRLAETRQARVINDLAAVEGPVSLHSRWLQQQGWRSSFTLPLFWGDELLGFLFLNDQGAQAFTPPVLAALEPHLELAAALIIHELSRLSQLRTTVQLALELTQLRDPETGAHLARVALYSHLIARSLTSQFDLPAGFADDLSLFAALHDIGKVAIPEAILRKPGPLDPQERRTMDSHVTRGLELAERMIEGLRLASHPRLPMLRQVISGHHELLDGSGYPLGLSGAAISLEARIVAVADIYDALTQVRVYKGALTPEEAERHLLQLAEAGRLDHHCVQALLDAREQRLAIAAADRDL